MAMTYLGVEPQSKVRFAVHISTISSQVLGMTEDFFPTCIERDNGYTNGHIMVLQNYIEIRKPPR
jgi:hypothetical protein